MNNIVLHIGERMPELFEQWKASEPMLPDAWAAYQFNPVATLRELTRNQRWKILRMIGNMDAESNVSMQYVCLGLAQHSEKGHIDDPLMESLATVDGFSEAMMYKRRCLIRGIIKSVCEA